MANFTVSTEETMRSSRRPRPDMPRGDGDFAAPVFYECLSDDGPFRRISDAEARRLVIFACLYYGAVATALVATLIWH
jgi:hypothetical protein